MGQNKQARSQRPNPLILLGIAVVAIAAIALVVFVSLPKKNDENNQQATQAQSPSVAFANFAKAYLGDDIDFDVSYIRGRSYAVDEAIANGEGKDFFEKVQPLFDKFNESVADTNLSLRGTVDRYRNLFNYTSIIGRTVFPTAESLLTDYIEKGEGTTIDEINILFTGLETTPYENSAEIITNEKAYYKSIIETYALYDEAGCIVDQKLDDTCLARKMTQADRTALANSNYEIFEQRIGFDKIISDSKRTLWTMDKLVNGENK